MCAVEIISAGHAPATLVAALTSDATSVTSGDHEPSERGTIGHSPCSHHRLLLVNLLVQLFAVSTRFVPPTARQLLAPSDLPPALERVAMQAQRGLQTWVAWTDDRRTWFVVAEMASILDYQGAAIRMSFFDEDGRQVSWGTWALQSAHSWILCER